MCVCVDIYTQIHSCTRVITCICTQFETQENNPLLSFKMVTIKFIGTFDVISKHIANIMNSLMKCIAVYIYIYGAYIYICIYDYILCARG